MTNPKRYTVVLAAHIRMSSGGACRVEEILDGDKLIGTKTKFQATRKDPVCVGYERNGAKYATGREFKAAYEAETT